MEGFWDSHWHSAAFIGSIESAWDHHCAVWSICEKLRMQQKRLAHPDAYFEGLGACNTGRQQGRIVCDQRGNLRIVT